MSSYLAENFLKANLIMEGGNLLPVNLYPFLNPSHDPVDYVDLHTGKDSLSNSMSNNVISIITEPLCQISMERHYASDTDVNFIVTKEFVAAVGALVADNTYIYDNIGSASWYTSKLLGYIQKHYPCDKVIMTSIYDVTPSVMERYLNFGMAFLKDTTLPAGTNILVRQDND